MQSFKNEIKKKSKFIEEIHILEELNNSKGEEIFFKLKSSFKFLGKLTKNASQNLISKLMQDAKRRNFEIEKKIKEKNEKEIKNVYFSSYKQLIINLGNSNGQHQIC